jgi:hypothetical protein
MKRVFIGALIVSTMSVTMATESRIIGLGKTDHFFRDDYSIFRNPSNLNLYPNMIIGSGGVFRQKDTTGEEVEHAALRRINRDPDRQWAGGILSYSFAEPTKNEQGGAEEEISQYPMFSVGVALNRYDENLDYFIPGQEKFNQLIGQDLGSIDSLYMPKAVGKIDLMGSYAFPGGTMLGLGFYVVNNNAGLGRNGDDADAQLSYIKGNVGLNTSLSTSTSLEASVGVTAIEAKMASYVGDTASLGTIASFSDSSDFIADVNLRLFSDLIVLNGKFVPRLGVTYYNLSSYTKMALNIGLGANLNIDRGFGWAGLEMLYEDEEGLAEIPNDETRKTMGARLSFGLERNIIWNWFLFRAGVSKTVKYIKQGDDVATWAENIEANGTKDDFLGIGVGVNVENRLKIDCIVAEDNCFTLTNLVSGPQHHIFTRFGVTYSF